MYVADIPFVFIQLFQSNSTEHHHERAWALKLLLHGLKDDQAYYMYKRNNVFELAMSSYDSVIGDKKAKVKTQNLLNYMFLDLKEMPKV